MVSLLSRLRSILPVVGREGARRPQIPAGQRVYAIGDVHGRADLLEGMIEAIEDDDAAGPGAATTVIMLGDLVDRGPDSARVVALARAWQQRRPVRILGGNHEEMFLRSFASLEVLRQFLRHGGRETIMSYGVDPWAYSKASAKEVQELMERAVPQEERAYIAAFESAIVVGDYLFVHAGIAPGVPLAEQNEVDLRWIREPFLSHKEAHEKIVVHGHSISETPDLPGNRIGIDTGAYASGRLTALALEGDTRRFLFAVAQEPGGVTIERQDLT